MTSFAHDAKRIVELEERNRYLETRVEALEDSATEIEEAHEKKIEALEDKFESQDEKIAEYEDKINELEDEKFADEERLDVEDLIQHLDREYLNGFPKTTDQTFDIYFERAIRALRNTIG